MGIFGVVFGFFVAGASQTIIKFFSDWVQAWIAWYQSGEYNYDGDETTPDECQGYNSGNGTWFDMEITEYQKPWLPGVGGVAFYTTDDEGKKHRNFHTWDVWVANRSKRRAR